MSSLTGLRILDFTHYIAGPYCCQILADHGADVIKVERLEGEINRQTKPLFKGESLYFASQNRNKRAFSLNLKDPKSKDIVQQLVKTADVVVTNYGSGVPERLGIGYEEISTINPKVIMVRITGFGSTGPYKDFAAIDGVAQAMSGLADLTGNPDGLPNNVGFYIADHIAGVQAALATMLAIHSRESNGKGQFVDISMLDSLVSMLGYFPGDVLLSGENRSRVGNSDRRAFASIYPAKEGYVYIAIISQTTWEELARMVGREDWADRDNPRFNTKDARLENRKEIEPVIAEWTKMHKREKIFSLLQKIKVPCGPVQSVMDIVNDPQIKDRSMIKTVRTPKNNDLPVPGVPIKLSETPAHEGVALIPGIGQHTGEILRELGFTIKEISALKQAKVI